MQLERRGNEVEDEKKSDILCRNFYVADTDTFLGYSAMLCR